MELAPLVGRARPTKTNSTPSNLRQDIVTEEEDNLSNGLIQTPTLSPKKL